MKKHASDLESATIAQASDPVPIAAHILSALFFSYIVWQSNNLNTAVISGVLLCLPSLIALLLSYEPLSRVRLVHLTTLLGASSGLFWTVSVLMFFPRTDPGLQLAAIIAVGGGALSLAFSYHCRSLVCLLAVLCPLPVTAYLMLGASNGVTLALLICVLWALLIWLMFQLNAAAIERIQINAEREQLIENIASKARALNQAQQSELEARKEAEAANEAKSRFLAQSSHDLRQPLHAMCLVLETLPTEHEDPQVGQIVERVKQSLSMLTQLFDSLLDLTLLDTGQLEVQSSPISLFNLMIQVKDDFKALAEANGVDIRVAPTRYWVNSDPVILRRITQNLVSNAIRHATKSKVLIGARSVGGAIALDVIDTGPGIPEELQEKIFNEFTTLNDRTDNKTDRGVGLGLSIVRKMTTALGLDVSVESTPQKGSRFRLSGLTAAKEPQHANGSSKRPSLSSGVTGRIAVFDDDQDTLIATSSLLKKWGFSVDAYPSWPVPLVNEPDMLICDFDLGASSTGFDIVKDIRGNSNRSLPALIVTGTDTQKLVPEAEALDLPVLAKPVVPAQLRSAILSALSKES